MATQADDHFHIITGSSTGSRALSVYNSPTMWGLEVGWVPGASERGNKATSAPASSHSTGPGWNLWSEHGRFSMLVHQLQKQHLNLVARPGKTEDKSIFKITEQHYRCELETSFIGKQQFSKWSTRRSSRRSGAAAFAWLWLMPILAVATFPVFGGAGAWLLCSPHWAWPFL